MITFVRAAVGVLLAINAPARRGRTRRGMSAFREERSDSVCRLPMPRCKKSYRCGGGTEQVRQAPDASVTAMAQLGLSCGAFRGGVPARPWHGSRRHP